jgi:hypothetical protein
VSVRIYVEGGFEGSTKSDCRRAFRLFFEKAVQRGSFRVIASGDRATAFRDFCAAFLQYPDDYIMLLVDSEEAVQGTPWQHLRLRVGDGWIRPNGAADDQAHLMVEVMESWFLADQSALTTYYGQGFLAGSLPKQPNVELVAKQTVYDALQHATKKTQKGAYHKTRHGFDLLELLDPTLVRTSSGHADRLFQVLDRET